MGFAGALNGYMRGWSWQDSHLDLSPEKFSHPPAHICLCHTPQRPGRHCGRWYGVFPLCLKEMGRYSWRDRFQSVLQSMASACWI